MTRQKKREAALNEIRRNIAKSGFHTYVVTGSGHPHYGYTIGLTESLGAEIILAGSYFYRLDEVAPVIRSVAEKLRSAVEWPTNTVRETPWGNFSFRRVDMSWAKELMLGVFDCYGPNAVEAWQIVPDESHWTVDIPDLSRPWSQNVAPGWLWLHQEWTYPVPKESVALTNVEALRGERVTEVMRWEKDEWEIFAGAGQDSTEADRRVVPLGIVLGAHPSVLPAVDLPVGCGFWRDPEPDSEWNAWGKPV